jgi:branched-chain amino acid transport system substrate-binding protein
LKAPTSPGYSIRTKENAVNLSAWVRHVPVAVTALALGLGGCGKKQDDNTIVVGHFASMTGAEATFGISSDNAIKIAIEERNAKGGVRGKKIVLKTIDDASKTTEASTAVTRLINDHGAVAILGEVASGRSLAGGAIAQKAKVPMISPSSTNPSVTDVGDYIFRVCFLDDFQGWVGAKFSRENLKAEKAAILYDQAQSYSSGLADFFSKAFEEMGGKIAVRLAFNGANLEISSQLQAIKGADVQVIYLPVYYGPAATIIRKARESGITAPFVGADGWDSEELAKNAGDAINGNYFSNHYAPEEDRPEVKNFVGKYKAAHGSLPDGLAALGYDAALVLFDAMERAKSLSGPDLRDAIAQTKNFTGVTGTFSIDAKRNAQKSAVVIKYEGGKQVMAARIEKK